MACLWILFNRPIIRPESAASCCMSHSMRICDRIACFRTAPTGWWCGVANTARLSCKVCSLTSQLFGQKRFSMTRVDVRSHPNPWRPKHYFHARFLCGPHAAVRRACSNHPPRPPPSSSHHPPERVASALLCVCASQMPSHT